MRFKIHGADEIACVRGGGLAVLLIGEPGPLDAPVVTAPHDNPCIVFVGETLASALREDMVGKTEVTDVRTGKSHYVDGARLAPIHNIEVWV